MIITETPLRVSFAGGGSDMRSYYRKFGGAVLSTAIDRYVYVTVNKKFDDWIRLSYSRTEEVQTVDEIQHPLVRAALRELSITGGVEITSVADIPSRGTGLGSSSSFTAGLLLALHAFKSSYISPGNLAEQSCKIEIDVCGEPIGKQDQYAAAFGGLNFIRFEADESVIVEPILCSSENLLRIESSLVTFYTGFTRQASTVLSEQTALTESCEVTQSLIHRMVSLAWQLRDELNSGNIHALGEVMDEGWRLKREIHSGVSNSEIDNLYNTAIRAGAVGGKLLGAGGGGFMTFFAPPEKQDQIEAAVGLRRVDFSLARSGSRVLLYHKKSTEARRDSRVAATTSA